LAVLGISTRADAQDRPAPAVDLSAAWVGFADDGVVGETLVGGAFRWPVSPRVAIGPELVYISGSRHSHAVVTGNLWWDLAPRRAGASSRVTPFLVAGGGAFSTRADFVRETFTSWEGAFTAGGGVRVAASDRVDVGVDARVGWELHLRVGGVVGIRLGR
jgi:opacity protein-like surface antigen